MSPSSASQSRAALEVTASSTGCASVADVLMMLNTSAIAVCWSSASVTSRFLSCSSLNRRAFSMAITAWRAKLSKSAI